MGSQEGEKKKKKGGGGTAVREEKRSAYGEAERPYQKKGKPIPVAIVNAKLNIYREEKGKKKTHPGGKGKGRGGMVRSCAL